MWEKRRKDDRVKAIDNINILTHQQGECETVGGKKRGSSLFYHRETKVSNAAGQKSIMTALLKKQFEENKAMLFFLKILSH